MTPEGSRPPQLQVTAIGSQPPVGSLQTIQVQQFPVQQYPGPTGPVVYQLVGTTQPQTLAVQQTGQFSVFGFQPIFPTLVQQSGVTAGTTSLNPLTNIGTLQPVTLQNLAKPVPDYINLQQQQHNQTINKSHQTQISSYFKETKKNVQPIAPKPDIDTDHSSSSLDSYCKPKKKKADPKSRRQLKKFNGMTEKELSSKGLPDYLKEGLNIVFIGINPSMHAAWTGKYYDGPGNHFWQCLEMSGLVEDLSMPLSAAEDKRLMDHGIGFTNVVERTTRGLADLSKEEISVGAVLLRKKLAYWKPRIVVFNGKVIYEVFAKQKKFLYGLQPEKMPGTDIVQWVMPSSSARCAMLPRASDKVPFFQALKKYSDFLKGRIPKPDDSEVMFTNLNLARNSPKKVKEEFVLTQYPNHDDNPSISPDSPTSEHSSQDDDDDDNNAKSLKQDPVHDIESQMPKLEREVPWPSVRNPQTKHKRDFAEYEQNNQRVPQNQAASPEPRDCQEHNDPQPINEQKSKKVNNNNNSSKSPVGGEIQSSEDDSAQNDDIVKCLKNQLDEEEDSDFELFLSMKEQTGEEGAFDKLITASDKKMSFTQKEIVEDSKRKACIKRAVNESWERSVSKRSKSSTSPRGDTLSVQCAAPWGESVPTFDLSDDYVNDYLKEKAKKCKVKSGEDTKEYSLVSPPKRKRQSSGLLMISPDPPPVSSRSSRSGSLDVITACLPESVGTEIGDIIQSGFTTMSEKDYNLDSELQLSTELQAQSGVSPVLRNCKGRRKKGGRKSRSGRSSPTKGAGLKDKLKTARKKSTEDLAPNMLPEDYLDEVIGQYFNNDSSSEEEPKNNEKSLKKQPVVMPILGDSEETSEDDAKGNRARTRPPASFFSMDFLDDADFSDHDDIENPEPALTKDKVKTDLEIEAEYRHILYGGTKRRKGPKIGLGKKKKKKKEEKTEAALKKEPKAFELPRKGKKVVKTPVKAKATILNELNSRQKPEITKKDSKSKIVHSVGKKGCLRNNEKGKTEVKCESTEIPLHVWKGKKPSIKAYDRRTIIARERKSFVSAKIVDVTGKYGKEEELVTCGICELLDPPMDPDNPLTVEEEVEWMGCDCYRWFHKCCTKLSKFTEKFSCKSVKMKCLEVGVSTKEPEIQIAILKFLRDRDTSFIEDLLRNRQ